MLAQVHRELQALGAVLLGDREPVHATPDHGLPVRAAREGRQHQLEALVLGQQLDVVDDAPAVDHRDPLLEEVGVQVDGARAAARERGAVLGEADQGVEPVDRVLGVDGDLRLVALLVQVVTPGFDHGVGAVGGESGAVDGGAVAHRLGRGDELVPGPLVVGRLGQHVLEALLLEQVDVDGEMVALGDVRPEVLLAVGPAELQVLGQEVGLVLGAEEGVDRLQDAGRGVLGEVRLVDPDEVRDVAGGDRGVVLGVDVEVLAVEVLNLDRDAGVGGLEVLHGGVPPVERLAVRLEAGLAAPLAPGPQAERLVGGSGARGRGAAAPGEQDGSDRHPHGRDCQVLTMHRSPPL
jgi:hypothetical protein